MTIPRSLNSRLDRLEHRLATLPCSCPESSDISWPGHQPNPHCPTCGGERLIYPLTHYPGPGEQLIRQALPILKKAYGAGRRADLSTLTNHELHQLKTALQAVAQAQPKTHAQRRTLNAEAQH
jgi:hypothetical protein